MLLLALPSLQSSAIVTLDKDQFSYRQHVW